MTRAEILKIAKPILFNTEMTRAILDNRKAVTRRPVKPQHLRVLDSPYHKNHPETPDKVLLERLCEPPYCPGDILYVRETWRRQPLKWSCEGGYSDFVLQYRADFTDEENGCYGRRGGIAPQKWHPSIHMPKEAARIFLRVTDVRVERLQDIDNAGALAEGCDGRGESPQDGGLSDWQKNYDFSVERFSVVWNSTIKPADLALYGWEANPWVWCYEFEKMEVES